MIAWPIPNAYEYYHLDPFNRSLRDTIYRPVDDGNIRPEKHHNPMHHRQYRCIGVTPGELVLMVLLPIRLVQSEP